MSSQRNNSRAVRAFAATVLLAISAWGQGMTKGIMSPPANVRPPRLENVGIEQHLDGQVPPGRREIAAWELGVLLEGIDLSKGRRRKRYSLPAPAISNGQAEEKNENPG